MIGVKAILAAPLFLPFAVALLFGNLDAWYPLLYGALVLAAFPTSGRWTWLAAGAAVAVVAIAKLHPAVLGLWLLVRVFADRDGPWRTVLVAARRHRRSRSSGRASLLGGIQPWLDYVAVIRAGAGAELVDPRNLGPVSLLGQATGMDAQALRVAQVVVTPDRGGRHRPRRVARPRPDREPGDRVHGLARGAAGDLVPLPGRAHPDRAGARDHAPRHAAVGRGRDRAGRGRAHRRTCAVPRPARVDGRAFRPVPGRTGPSSGGWRRLDRPSGSAAVRKCRRGRARRNRDKGCHQQRE